jgi:hypothetical protein
MPLLRNDDHVAHAICGLVRRADVVERDDARPLLDALELKYVGARRSWHWEAACDVRPIDKRDGSVVVGRLPVEARRWMRLQLDGEVLPLHNGDARSERRCAACGCTRTWGR